MTLDTSTVSLDDPEWKQTLAVDDTYYDVFEALVTAAPEPKTGSEIARDLDWTRQRVLNRLHDLDSQGAPLKSKSVGGGGRARIWWFPNCDCNDPLENLDG